MPQAWITSTPSLAKSSISDGGQVEPPITARLNVVNDKLPAFTCWTRPAQIVGTPAEAVTPSRSIRL